MSKLRIVIGILLLGVGPSAFAQTTFLTPSWVKYLGNGVGGSYSCNSGTCGLTDERWLTSFTVGSGATLVNTAGNGPLIIRSTGTCTIAGTISGSPNQGSFGITGTGDFGGGGGGGGGGNAAGKGGVTTTVIPNIPLVNGGTGGSAGGGGGGAGTSTQSGQYHMFLSNSGSWPGGGAPGGQGGSNGGSGGKGGTPIIIICNEINFTGTINVSGGNGGNSSSNGEGAGGGGGGGYVVLAAVQFINNSGNINTNGGSGGNCSGHGTCGSGGSGGNGWSMSMTIQ
jgi:hypothetical protein